MDDAELYDLMVEIKDLDSLDEPLTTTEQIALLQVKAITAHGYQLFRLGLLIEDLMDTTPAPSRWQRMRRWVP